MKKNLALLVSLIFVVGLFSGFAAKQEEIKIGVVAPLSGAVSTYGNSAKNALMLLQDQVNAAGGINGKKLNLISYDDEGKAATAATVGSKLINQDRVVAIVGPLTSGCANALGPIAQASKIPMITGTATAASVTSAGNFIFRTCFIDPFQGTVVAKFALKDLKTKKVAILYDNGNDYSKGLAEAFEKSFKAIGGTIIAKETYSTGDQDFNAQITKIKSKSPAALYLPDYYNVVGLIAKQARAQGITVPLLGCDGWDSAELKKFGGTAVNNSYFSNHYSADSTSPEVVKFVKEYKAKYKAVPDALAALSYDAGKILIDAIKKSGKTDGESIRKALVKTNIKVVSGKVTFDNNRNAIKSAVILKVDKGTVKYVKTVNP